MPRTARFIFVLLLVFGLLLSLAACGRVVPLSAAGPAPEQTLSPLVIPTVGPTAKPTPGTAPEQPMSTPDPTPTPALPYAVGVRYVGLWASSAALLRVTGQGDGLRMEILRDDTVTERLVWTYDTVYDPEGNRLVCSGLGRLTRTPYDPQLRPLETEEVYGDGSAAFRLGEDGALMWADFREGGGETAFFPVEGLPDLYDGVWTSEDGAMLLFFPGECTVRCVIWSGDSSCRWVYGVCVFDPASGTLRSLRTGVKTELEPDTGESVHLYTDGRAVFAPDREGRLLWREEREGEGPTVCRQLRSDGAQ